jgi:branched-chain amino acid aminotransferase
MSTQFIYLNNELVPTTHPIFAATHRAWRYGDSLFESMRMVNGILKFADLHADRLRRGMKILKMEGYTQIDAAFLQDKFDGDKLVEGNKTIEYSIVSMIKDLNLNLLLCNLQIHINFLFLP